MFNFISKHSTLNEKLQWWKSEREKEELSPSLSCFLMNSLSPCCLSPPDTEPRWIISLLHACQKKNPKKSTKIQFWPGFQTETTSHLRWNWIFLLFPPHPHLHEWHRQRPKHIIWVTYFPPRSRLGGRRRLLHPVPEPAAWQGSWRLHIWCHHTAKSSQPLQDEAHCTLRTLHRAAGFALDRLSTNFLLRPERNSPRC